MLFVRFIYKLTISFETDELTTKRKIKHNIEKSLSLITDNSLSLMVIQTTTFQLHLFHPYSLPGICYLGDEPMEEDGATVRM